MNPSDPSARTSEILARHGAVVIDDHFVYTSGRHGDKYINKDAPFPHTNDFLDLCEMIADPFCDDPPDGVVGPAVAGATVAFLVAYHLCRKTGKRVFVGYADKTPEGGLVIKRGFDSLVRGSRILGAEDIINTGKTSRALVRAIQDCQGEPIGMGALVNRGGVTAAMLGVPRLDVLLDVNFISYAATVEEPCPLCLAGVPINVQLGHGRAYVEKHGQPVARS